MTPTHEHLSVHPTAVISPSAIIEPGARIGARTRVGHYSVVGSKVVIGADVHVGPHVVIEGRTTIGDGCQIFQFASLGARPQDLKYAGEESELLIGCRNIIREYVTLQPGTAHGVMKTTIGDDNLFMACSHVAHDVTIGNRTIVANSAALAGHVTIGDRVVIGGLAGIHQFVRVGSLAMIGAGSMVSRDVPPAALTQGDRARFVGVNVVGLERAGISREHSRRLKSFYRRVYGSGLCVETIAQLCESEFSDVPLASEVFRFISDSKRGVVVPRRRSKGGEEDEEA